MIDFETIKNKGEKLYGYDDLVKFKAYGNKCLLTIVYEPYFRKENEYLVRVEKIHSEIKERYLGYSSQFPDKLTYSLLEALIFYRSYEQKLDKKLKPNK